MIEIKVNENIYKKNLIELNGVVEYMEVQEN